MNYLNKLIQYFTFIFFSLNINAQNSQPGTKPFDMQIKTPGVTDFVKYGNLSSTSYTGELKVNIPIANIPIPSNSPFDISLSYVGSGFRPSKRNGLVGQNWFLNVGGAITREINGMPDDQKGKPEVNGYMPNYTNGFMVGLTSKTHNAQDVFNFSSTTSYTSLFMERYLYANSTQTSNDPKNYEGDPDIFSFNFNGISGKFFMGNDGQVKVVTSDPHKLSVDLSQLTFQEVVSQNLCRPKTPSRIIITDEKGNKYYFGGETKNLEYTLTVSNNSGDNQSDHRPVITAWYMYKIEYYTGYTINFNYRDDSALTNTFADEYLIVHGGYYPAYSGNSPNKRDFVVLSESYGEERNLYETYGSYPGTGGIGGTANANLYLTLQKIAILDNIEGDDFKVTFSYSRQDHKFNTRDNTSLPKNNYSFFNNFIDIKLDGINVQSKYGSDFSIFQLGYTYLGGSTHSRMFLSSITEQGKPPHTFQYFSTGTLPQPVTFGIDHWGFWNGKAANTNPIIPYTILDTNGDFSYTTDAISISRNPNFSSALVGQLQKVIYPTGGWSEFEYEANTYSKRLETRSTDNFVPKIYNVNGTAGGVRIKKISDYDGTLYSNIKEYKYLNNYDTSGTSSSGVLLKWPRYAASWTCPGSQKFGYIRSSPIGKNIMDTPHITYSEVAELTSGNGYTLTKFRDIVSNPDIDVSNFVASNVFASCVTPAGLAKNYIGYFLNDTSHERGKPSKVKIYDASNNIKEETTFEYNELTDRFGQFTSKIHTTGPFIQSNKVYFYQDYLTKKIQKTYLGSISQFVNNTIETQYDYTNNTVKKEIFTNSMNDVIDNEYTYAYVPANNLLLLNKTIKSKNSNKLFEEKIEYGNSTDPVTNNKYLAKK